MERSDARVTALTDFNPVRVKAAAQMFPVAPVCYTQIEETLARETLDAVIVTSPDFCHAGHVIAALRAGIRHVFVDKPLATTAQDCLNVVDAARETSGDAAIGFNMRHLPQIQKIKEVIDEGLIGSLMMISDQEFYDGGADPLLLDDF